jgi:hypothetical protein
MAGCGLMLVAALASGPLPAAWRPPWLAPAGAAADGGDPQARLSTGASSQQPGHSQPGASSLFQPVPDGQFQPTPMVTHPLRGLGARVLASLATTFGPRTAGFPASDTAGPTATYTALRRAANPVMNEEDHGVGSRPAPGDRQPGEEALAATAGQGARLRLKLDGAASLATYISSGLDGLMAGCR